MMDDTKQRLVSAAGKVFAEKGFAAASVRTICQAAAANVAAVHYHFGDKRQLYVAAVRAAQCTQSSEFPFPEFPPSTPAEIRLRAFIGTMFERMLDSNRPRWHLQLMLRELAHPTDACETIVNDYIRPMADALRTILADLLPAEMSEAERWRMGFSIVGQILFYYINRPIVRLLLGPEADAQLSVDGLADHVTRFSLAAIRHTPCLLNESASVDLAPNSTAEAPR